MSGRVPQPDVFLTMTADGSHACSNNDSTSFRRELARYVIRRQSFQEKTSERGLSEPGYIP